MKKIELPFIQVLGKRLREKAPLIQVVLGPRQVGKTTGVLQCLQKSPLPHVYASAEDNLTPNAQWILEKWQQAKLHAKNNILVLDEIQKVPQWSDVIKKLWDEQARQPKQPIRLVLLGSSSLSIQRGLTESLTGRFELIQLHHWNFHETNQLKKMSLEDYLRYGGYPGSYALLKEPKRWIRYVRESIIETVIGKDILQLHTVRSPALFRQAFEILMSYPAQEISYNKLLGQLQDKGNTDLIKYYIQLYEGAFLLKTLEKYSAKAHLRKSSSPKVIPLCPGLVHLACPNKSQPDFIGRLFEMIVGAELNRLEGNLTYWRDGKNEVDYVLELTDQLFAIEVKSGRKKSPKGLGKFCESYPQARPLFITRENFSDLSQEGLGLLRKL